MKVHMFSLGRLNLKTNSLILLSRRSNTMNGVMTFFAFMIILSGCKSDGSIQKSVIVNNKGISFVFECRGNQNDKIADLFSENVSLDIQFEGKDNPVFSITFAQPTYVSEIRLIVPKQNDGKMPHQIRMDFSWEKGGVICDYLIYDIKTDSPIQIITLNNSNYASILKYGYVSFSFVKDGQYQDDDKSMKINKIFVKTTITPQYKLKGITLDEIVQKHVKNVDGQYRLSEDSMGVLSDLIYLAVMGDKKAEKIFLSLSNEHADLGAFLSNLQDWYYFTQKSTK